MRKPVGKVNPVNQNKTGGWAVDAHLENCSTLSTKSLVHAPNGLRDGYALGEKEREREREWNTCTCTC